MGNGYPLQYPCLENSMGRGAWQATVLGVTKSRYDRVAEHTHTHMNAVYQRIIHSSESPPPWPKILTSLSVQSLSRVQLFATPWTAACQASLSITDSQSLLQLMFIKSMMPSNHLILCCPSLWHRPIISLELHDIFICNKFVIFTHYRLSKEQRVHPIKITKCFLKKCFI